MNRFVAIMMVAVAFAGCASDDAPEETFVDKETFELESGKGAISGLVVDDRFRPIELGNEANSEFQAIGFVLLQETGEQVSTTENGEFTFVDLDPGRYKIRVQSSAHEAKTTTVEVVAGKFADISIVSQRKVSDTTTILTQEYSVFVDCYIDLPGILWWTELNCFLDMSLDSKRGGFQTDYSAVNNITYMVSEYLFNQPGDFGVNVGYAEGESIEEEWASTTTKGSDYAKLVMATGEYYNASADLLDGELQAHRQFLTYVSPEGSTPSFGIAVEAQIIQTVWLGEPEEDVYNYCVLCEA